MTQPSPPCAVPVPSHTFSFPLPYPFLREVRGIGTILVVTDGWFISAMPLINTSDITLWSMVSRCKLFWNYSVAFFAILSFLVFFHVILVLIVFACFGFSSLHHSKWVRSIYILICQAYFVYFCYYRSSVSFVMFHPVIVTVCFSVIYLVSHIYPSSSSLTLHHDCLNLSVSTGDTRKTSCVCQRLSLTIQRSNAICFKGSLALNNADNDS